MDIHYKHWFECRNGKLIFDNRETYRTNVSLIKGKRGYLVLYEESENDPVSSGSQRHYFKVLIEELAHHTDFYGMSKIAIHHYLMGFFNGTFEFIDGEWVEFTPSMRSLNAKEWAAYIEKVEYFCGERGILPKPLNVYKFKHNDSGSDNRE